VGAGRLSMTDVISSCMSFSVLTALFLPPSPPLPPRGEALLFPPFDDSLFGFFPLRRRFTSLGRQTDPPNFIFDGKSLNIPALLVFSPRVLFFFPGRSAQPGKALLSLACTLTHPLLINKRCLVGQSSGALPIFSNRLLHIHRVVRGSRDAPRPFSPLPEALSFS